MDIYQRFAFDLNELAQVWETFEIKIVGITYLDFQRLQDAARAKEIGVKLKWITPPSAVYD